MITLENDRLVFRFPEVHEDAMCAIEFQRTLRLPDDGRTYPLPPGLGRFPLRHLDDHADRLPADWRRRGGVAMPMYQSEALWISFRDGGFLDGGYPCAVKIATGKVNAVSGESWSPTLHRHPQDYLVVPKQPWLDGYNVEKGAIRQFVATPLGEGLTAEEQLTGAAEWGGLQLLVYPMRAETYERQLREFAERASLCLHAPMADMGLAPGGRMHQEIYADPYGLEDWDQRHSARCFVTILNTWQWLAVTNERPPHGPPTAKIYTEAGLPWFKYYDADARALEGSGILAKLKSVNGCGAKRRPPADAADEGVIEPGNIRKLGPRTSVVREGEL